MNLLISHMWVQFPPSLPINVKEVNMANVENDNIFPIAENDNLVLIGGESSAGKSLSLMGLRNPEGVMYLNCEANKKLPFPAKFKQYSITDPYQVHEAFAYVTQNESFHTIVVDTLTFLMEMFHSKYIHGVKDGMAGWAHYQQFFKKLMQDYVAKATVNVIFLAHVHAVLNESAMTMEKKVPVMGALAKNGIEAYFSTVVSVRRIPLPELENYQNDMLVITPEEEMLGYKHVYQTRLTKETVNERIRASIGMWDVKETFIDNNAQLLLDRLHKYYGQYITTQ